jgi:hypothetical protein
MALQNWLVQQQLEATRMQLNFACLRLSLLEIAWPPVPGSGEDMEQDLSGAGGGGGNADQKEGV